MRTARIVDDQVNEVSEMHLLTHSLPKLNDDPEFSSEPMPAAFSVCLFLGLGLVLCALAFIFL